MIQAFLYIAGDFSTIGNLDASINAKAVSYDGISFYRLDLGTSGTLGRSIISDGDNIYYADNDTFGTVSRSGSTIVSYSGTYRAYPIIKVINPSGATGRLILISNELTGASLHFDYLIVAGETITIDTRPGKQTINSNIKGNIYYSLLASSSSFGNFYLSQGNDESAKDNLINVLCNAVSPTANMIWRNAYISED